MALREDQARKLIEAARFDERESWMALPQVAADPAGIAAAAAVLAQDGVPAPAMLWAALEVYSAGGEDPAPLRPLVAHGASAVRIRAADGLLARGEREGFSVLVEELSNTEPARGGRLHGPAWRSAAEALVRRTAEWRNGPPLDATESQVVAAAERWRAWLEEKGASLVFRPETGEWRLP